MVQSSGIRVAFYSSLQGREPVRKWLSSLDRESERAIREDIETARVGWPVGMPLARSLGHGLWEIRTNTARGPARVIFVVHEGMIILLHGFLKKSRKTPHMELGLARRRSRALKRRREA